MKPSVKIYTISTCSDCHQAKRYFKEHQIDFIEYNCEDNPEYAEEVLRLTGMQTVPTIVIDDQVFVGFADHFKEITALLG
ncbi:glutaredoxin family protein [Paenibacillus sp. VCA1]|uniref:glutaredoxin family protein n=1 Tax=Paenibacillus sp. VCA1 TaxID=3039148 RepID=UPI002871AACA|nr:glutaredoxin family protein [Paenibacillus sp. VCA1]MDR9854905.1 glutaredoxin family protein [Paenibacillus sp. VCA1]